MRVEYKIKKSSHRIPGMDAVYGGGISEAKLRRGGPADSGLSKDYIGL